MLHNAKLIIELGPGDPMFICSACIEHENTPIGSNESRRSLVGYSAGGLFRWLAQGCMKQEDLKVHNLQLYNSLYGEGVGEKRWVDGKKLFAEYSEVVNRVQNS